MTIWEALTGRSASRQAVAIEMLIMCIGGVPALTYALAGMQLSQPMPLMIGLALGIVAVGIYVRALRLHSPD